MFLVSVMALAAEASDYFVTAASHKKRSAMLGSSTRAPANFLRRTYMKRILLSTSLALAVAGFLGTGVALAQQYNAPVATPPTPSATPDASWAPTADQVAVPMRTDSGPSAFAKLDTKHRGYLISEDVSQLHGFNFKDADKNNDGRLDATEFNAAWVIYSGRPKS
jgi:hypothetical protein